MTGAAAGGTRANTSTINITNPVKGIIRVCGIDETPGVVSCDLIDQIFLLCEVD